MAIQIENRLLQDAIKAEKVSRDLHDALVAVQHLDGCWCSEWGALHQARCEQARRAVAAYAAWLEE